MKITFKNFKHSAFASKDSTCFEAVVCIDGKPAFLASNDGGGGLDYYHPLNGQTSEQMQNHLARLSAYAMTLPPTEYFGTKITYDTQLVIGQAVEREIARRDLCRRLRTHVLFTAANKPGSVFAVRGQLSDTLRSWLTSQKHADKILNSMPIDDALECYIKAS